MNHLKYSYYNFNYKYNSNMILNKNLLDKVNNLLTNAVRKRLILDNHFVHYYLVVWIIVGMFYCIKIIKRKG